MTLEINIGRPSLRELLEISESNEYRIFTKPHGRVSELFKKIVGKAVPWKHVTGESYKKSYAKQYNNQQTAADAVRSVAASEAGVTYKRGMKNMVKGEALVEYVDGEYGVVPYWSGLLGKKGKKGTIKEIKGIYSTKQEALAHLPATAKRELEMAEYGIMPLVPA